MKLLLIKNIWLIFILRPLVANSSLHLVQHSPKPQQFNFLQLNHHLYIQLSSAFLKPNSTESSLNFPSKSVCLSPLVSISLQS
ncbi:hypothetical protein PGT21_009813 [Puccinia graminis f. sp. tritici]|uniref:Uncharacterized protein n=1 Tax=Puccinia graminis f. sp. tritici TaxID=56615 RepID=A0A5B0R034_PUCGR|nr:hypothetical protein PGT21_009813 [Puccinia graminis f. sp. tritici]